MHAGGVVPAAAPGGQAQNSGEKRDSPMACSEIRRALVATSDIDIAIRASTSSNLGRSARNCLHARKALVEIQKGLAKPAHHGLSEEQVIYLEQRCAEIEVALRSEEH